MITLKKSLHSNDRGPGLWKLDTSFLTEINFLNLIKATIQETPEEYNEDVSVSPSLLWEMTKLKVRENHYRTLRFGRNKQNSEKKS